MINHESSGVESDDGEGRDVDLGEDGVGFLSFRHELGVADENVGPLHRIHRLLELGGEGGRLDLVLVARNLVVEVAVVADVGRRFCGEFQLQHSFVASENISLA